MIQNMLYACMLVGGGCAFTNHLFVSVNSCMTDGNNGGLQLHPSHSCAMGVFGEYDSMTLQSN